ncbi:MAG: NUDIX domain-containing protein [Candidatus Thermoplasmatota archaeon]|nr:NUDIX domain-containing protein [Candidatus Thermoplasmatota archaeon]
MLLLGPDGQILLQRRSQSKRVYPDLWTSSASGHVSAGQTPLEAAAREVEEELGCRAQALEQVDVHRFQDPDVGENERVHVFLAGATGRLDPDAREVSATRWIQPEDLDAWLQRSPDAFAPSFPPVWAGAQAHVLGKP